MTTQEFTVLAVPFVRHSARAAAPLIAQAVGRLGWLLLWPAWKQVTGPVLPILVRIGIELAIGLTAPSLLPLFEALERLVSVIAAPVLPALERQLFLDLCALLRTSRAEMLEPVRQTLALAPGAVAAEG